MKSVGQIVIKNALTHVGSHAFSLIIAVDSLENAHPIEHKLIETCCHFVAMKSKLQSEK